MKIIAWNVNGLRSLLKTEHLDNLINNEDPDILCMGETKLSCPYDNINTIIKTRYPKFKYLYWSQCKTKNGYKPTNCYYKNGNLIET
jgi:exonuclease III